MKRKKHPMLAQFESTTLENMKKMERLKIEAQKSKEEKIRDEIHR